MEIKHTLGSGGVTLLSFKDSGGIDCNMQISTSGEMAKIWIGCAEPDLKILIPGAGWQRVNLPFEVYSNNRMHLSQSQVYDLLPTLAFFAEHGVLPVEHAVANPVKVIEAAMGDRRLIHEEILRIGQQLSNAAHALKQDSSIDERTRQTMADLQKRWDEAYSAWYRVPGTPKQNSGTS